MVELLRETMAPELRAPVIQQKIRVLVAEDSPGEAGSALRAAYREADGQLEITDVGSITTLLPTISMVNPDVVLLDLTLAGPDPVDVVRRVHRSAPKVPLIVLVGNPDRETAARCLEVGAIDYLLKGVMKVHTISLAVRTALERNTLDGLTDLMRDPLTQLYTGDGLMTLGSRAMETARRSAGTLVLLCALLENLASLREELGTRNTEQLVKELAQLLRASFRRTDVVARLGEAQFAALAVDAAEPSAPVLRQRVQRRLNTFNQLRDPAEGIQIRMAVSFWSPQDHRSFPKLLDSVEAELRSSCVAPREESKEPANATSR
jgi:two-component system cell cycle response regulator